MLRDMKYAINTENHNDNIYFLYGMDENGKAMAVITYYSDDTLGNQ